MWKCSTTPSFLPFYPRQIPFFLPPSPLHLLLSPTKPPPSPQGSSRKERGRGRGAVLKCVKWWRGREKGSFLSLLLFPGRCTSLSRRGRERKLWRYQSPLPPLFPSGCAWQKAYTSTAAAPRRGACKILEGRKIDKCVRVAPNFCMHKAVNSTIF